MRSASLSMNACGRSPFIIRAMFFATPFKVAGGGTEPSGSASRMCRTRSSASTVASAAAAVTGCTTSFISSLSCGDVRTPVRLRPMRVASMDSCMTGSGKLQVGDFARQLGAGLPDVTGSDRLGRRALRVHVIAIVERALRLLVQADELGAAGSHVDFTRERVTHECTLTRERHRLGQPLADDLPRVAPLVLLEQVRDQAQVTELIAQHPLPDRFQPWVA